MDPGGEPLERLLGAPMEVGSFLGLAIGIAAAVDKVHQHGLIRRDLKPTNTLVKCADRQVRLTGFGLASRLPRERQAPEPPEVIADTLAYTSPEQTGRMNRSIDSCTDLYWLGITLYQTLRNGFGGFWATQILPLGDPASSVGYTDLEKRHLQESTPAAGRLTFAELVAARGSSEPAAAPSVPLRGDVELYERVGSATLAFNSAFGLGWLGFPRHNSGALTRVVDPQ